MMGCYINPRTISKEDWLKENATETDDPCLVAKTHLPVCLVENREIHGSIRLLPPPGDRAGPRGDRRTQVRMV